MFKVYSIITYSIIVLYSVNIILHDQIGINYRYVQIHKMYKIF